MVEVEVAGEAGEAEDEGMEEVSALCCARCVYSPATLSPAPSCSRALSTRWHSARQLLSLSCTSEEMRKDGAQMRAPGL